MSRNLNPGMFGRISQHCEIGHLLAIGLITLEKKNRSNLHDSCIIDVHLDKKVPC